MTAMKTDEQLALALIKKVREDLDSNAALLSSRVERCLTYLDQVVASNNITLKHVRRYLDGSYDGMEV